MHSSGAGPLTDELAGLLAFAAGSRRADGGFGYLSADGSVLADRPRETYVTARMTHVFALGSMLGLPGADELAAHGVRALSGPFRDAANGGWVASLGPADGAADGTKAAYVHAFVVLAAASAATAGVPGGPALLADALAAWDAHFWDDAAGLAVEEWDAGWSTCSDYRGVNANMHGVEAMLAAADALEAPGVGPLPGPSAGRLRTRAERVVERVVHGWAREADWRLPEHFDASWTVLPEYNADRPSDPFRPYGVTVGHQLEWSGLALHTAAVLGPDAPAWLQADAPALYGAAVERGWRADGHDGFVYTLDWSDRPVVAARMHWVLAEAVGAAAVLAAVTGDPRYADDGRRWEEHAAARFRDAVRGSWHHELTPEGAVGTTTWVGKPDVYHVVQALLLPRIPVRGSVAAGVRAALAGDPA
ncbi:Mannose or cellobiose epimerase, N-acyl-D-glucosamine 2-epimerase family [Modestobacter sp. DSM 44400]|uniref:AGE family epimerase/isomerase n=1 Tax=Modestobacter sp. DSM 44400 TaxID=1550230 RepID=UPI00089D7563|nr:AGE family epimerase/isomerase [Modestobacter sp. DSM 44400]SDY56351.1 Mannose or cellobiose epimerase, N-acyl-D-glucosamine 2-epimerase family [Modestobacter sp. DSM 44400]